jgi:enoyl-CoA hydratase/carnithine racemase
VSYWTDRARELGLFTRLFERDSFETCFESVVDTIATGPAAALASSKALLNDRHGSLASALDAEARAQAVLLGTRDPEEGATAFVERREPEFDGR